MLGSLSTRTVIGICLFVAVCTLFLRTIVYHGQVKPAVSTTGKDQSPASPLIILAYHDRPPYYVTGRDQYLTGLVGKPAVAADSATEGTAVRSR